MKSANHISSELGNLIDIVIDYRGKTPKKLKGEWSEMGIPALSAKNIKNGKIVNEKTIRFVNEDLYSKWMKKEVKKGDILMTSEAPLGETYLLKTDDKLLLSQRLFAIRVNQKKINPKYLFYYFNTDVGKRELLSRATGTTVGGIRQTALLKVVVNYPEDLNLQAKIASILSAYDDLIENNEKRIKALEEMAQHLYIEWFVKFDFPEHEKVGMVNSKTDFGMIPSGWELKKLSDLVYINPPTKITNKNQVIHVPMECLSTTLSFIDLDKTFRKEGGSGSKFINGDTLFARITPCLQNGKGAFVNFLDVGEIGCGSTEFVVMRSKVLSPTYIYFLSRSPNFRKSAESTMVGASGRQRVRSEFFQNYLIPVPTSLLLDEFESLTKNIFGIIKTLSLANRSLSQIRDLLIPQLVTGKKEVKNNLCQK